METFNYPPYYVFEYTTDHNVLISTFESGREQRRYKGVRPRKWKLTFRQTPSRINRIVEFFNERKGSYEAFEWTPPGASSPIRVRFEANSLRTSYQGKMFAECELVIQEVIE